MTTEPIESRVLPAITRLLDRGELKGGVMVKLAKEAGMSLSTLYSIVPGKADLMFVVAAYLQRTAMQQVAARLSGTETERELVLANALESLELFTAGPEMGLQFLAPESAQQSTHGWRESRSPSDDAWLRLDGANAQPLNAMPTDAAGLRSQLVTYAWLGVVLHRCQELLSEQEAIQLVTRIVNTVYGYEESPGPDAAASTA